MIINLLTTNLVFLVPIKHISSKRIGLYFKAFQLNDLNSQMMINQLSYIK
uniref:Uncharacterized protein n=1 Tax=Rhizophora mucronata TaxID=61149 RepID=A0A2P2IW16_RHIMU